MARPRTPIDKAKITGRLTKNPGRFAGRSKSSKHDALGAPPRWFDKKQSAEWVKFKRELSWLTGSHRALLEIACTIRARLAAKEDVGIQALNLLRQCLGQLGATPADESKVSLPEEDDADDPAQGFLG